MLFINTTKDTLKNILSTDSLVVESALIWFKLSLMLAHFHSRSCGRSGGALSINGSMALAIAWVCL